MPKLSQFLIVAVISVLTSLTLASAQPASDGSISRLSQLPPEAQSSVISTLATLSETSGQASDFMGLSVAIAGNTVVVGAPQQGAFGTLPGAVYVFVKPASGWANLTPTATLTASDQNTSLHPNELGVSVAISGNTIIAGAPWSGSSTLGAVYVYAKPASGWQDATETAKLTTTELTTTTASFATAVAISGTTIVASDEEVDNIGAAYVFVKPAGGWVSATQTAKLSPSTSNARFFGDHSIAISGDTVVVGCPLQFRGTAYVFTMPASGWQDMTETAQLQASDETNIDEYSSSVAISQGAILVGSPYAVVNGVQSGTAYVYLKPAGGWKTTKRFAAKLSPSDGTTQDAFGFSVGFTGATAVIGSPDHPNEGVGSVYVFTRPASGWASASQPASLVGSGTGSNFAHAVAISGSTIVAGSPYATVGPNILQGLAYVLGQ